MKANAMLMMLLMLTAALSGCAGDESEEWIDQLEQEATNHEGVMESLNRTLEFLQGDIALLNTTIESLNGQIGSLDGQILQHISEITALNEQNTSMTMEIEQLSSLIFTLNESKIGLESEVVVLENARSSLTTQISSLETVKASLEVQVASLTTVNQELVATNANSADAILDLQEIAASLNSTISGLLETIAELENSPPSSVNWSSTLDVVIERGFLKCGVKDSQYGMGYYDEDTGRLSGLDISYCMAIAAAIGFNPDSDIEYVNTNADRFELLSNGSVDVLIRTTTWTASRDADLNFDFGAINFFDGQGIMVNLDEFPNADSALDLDGASICVAIGSTSAGNIEDYFVENDMEYQAVSSWNDGPDFANENCDAVTGDMSALVSMKWQIEQDGSADFEMAIMPEVISKEPLASVTRDYDSEWNEVVSWVWHGMVTAEEFGITSYNYQSADTSNPSIDRLLNENLGLGTQLNPLDNTWMQSVLSSVGNYGEAYDDAFCDGSYDGYSGSESMSSCLMPRSGTLNALESEGGLQYAPPMR
ncbi:MAG: transporter substrate-binding domain-containing protein [Euryarchaeota archaeon]|jgi:general L-amino acid transport system substrate-binding protein|nr:transporter substrate-binding domain-containing protein [Euryarchaeota archaeon]MBT6684227.1 transporter substrate-binding domain-containing protein [Euryarchaeota archaeon]